MDWFSFVIYLSLGLMVYYLGVFFYFRLSLSNQQEGREKKKETIIKTEEQESEPELTIKTKY